MIKTLKILPKDPEQGEYVIINAVDFDPKIHERHPDDADTEIPGPYDSFSRGELQNELRARLNHHINTLSDEELRKSLEAKDEFDRARAEADAAPAVEGEDEAGQDGETVEGDEDNDVISPDEAADLISGGGEATPTPEVQTPDQVADAISTPAGGDTVATGEGSDAVSGSAAADSVVSGADEDAVQFDGAADAGNDSVDAGTGELIHGEPAKDAPQVELPPAGDEPPVRGSTGEGDPSADTQSADGEKTPQDPDGDRLSGEHRSKAELQAAITARGGSFPANASARKLEQILAVLPEVAPPAADGASE